VAEFVAKPERDRRQHAEKVFSVAEIGRQGDGDQQDGKTGENEVAGAHGKWIRG
jgi:hypothetical protein